MANKRMFSLSVVDTDRFLEMPISSRLLYYELGMRADDDGFVDNWKKILMFTGLKEDDMKVLMSKNFIIPFDSGVIVIRHWRMNNYLQKDRIKPTIYQEELKKLEVDKNNVYNLDTNCIHSIDKNRLDIDENSIEYSNSNNKNIYETFEENLGRTLAPVEYEKIKTWLEDIDQEIIEYALKIAILSNKKNFNYIDGILRNWKTSGYKTLEEVKESEKIKTNEKQEEIEIDEEILNYEWFEEMRDEDE